jgi:hypothetical protein
MANKTQKIISLFAAVILASRWILKIDPSPHLFITSFRRVAFTPRRLASDRGFETATEKPSLFFVFFTSLLPVLVHDTSRIFFFGGWMV